MSSGGLKSLKLLVLLLIISTVTVAAQPSPSEVERRINALLARMTLAEKLGQLQQLDGHADGRYKDEHPDLVRRGLLGSTLNVRGVRQTNELQRIAVNESRLKIPLIFGFDVIHGYRTLFPIPLGEASSWDLESVELAATIAAREARAAGVHWTFAPMVDIARDPRWGRIAEGAGEDPYLGAAMARARVRGFQGANYSAPDRVVACAKHWVAYGAAEAGRDYNTTDMSEVTLREIYLPPFKAAIDAGVGTFMSAFNDLNGVPTSANPFTLTQILRREWKFDGFVVSDYESVRELMNHRLAATEQDAAREAINAGVDMEMVSRLFNKHGAELVRDGKVSIATINEAVRRVLRIKFRLGLFENPYADEARESRTIMNAEHVSAARNVAARSFVLLKNERETLPIKRVERGRQTIAVVGPLADDKKNLIGSWAGDGRAEDAVTVLEGVRARAGGSDVRVTHARGCDIPCNGDEGFAEAVRAARDADFTVVVIGESAEMSGEAASRSSLDLPGKQLELVQMIHATAKPYAVVLMNGRPLTINWLADNSPAILETWFAGTQAGNAIADVLFGDVNPSGKLPVTFPRNVGQIPIYYNYKATGRPPDPNNKYTSKYLDVPVSPLYPFGFGLSYTQFRISDLRLSARSIPANGRLTASVEVENTGRREGAEVVQLYLSDVAASRTRAIRELKGFERVTLRPGEKRRVEFTLTPEHLGFYNREMRFVVEPGAFKVFVGNSSVGGIEASFEVTGNAPVRNRRR
jgi:beta-glucosidase